MIYGYMRSSNSETWVLGSLQIFKTIDSDKEGMIKGLNNYQDHFEVYLRYHMLYVIIQGIWNHNIGNYLGPHITVFGLI